jgi:hypothetical protein
MNEFKLITKEGQKIEFEFYYEAAPVTCNAFNKLLPFTTVLFHAKTSGQEIWTDKVPQLDIIQENASIYTEPGEVVFGPMNPVRSKTANCFGIYYGEGKGLDACNIFAKVVPGDRGKLIELGNAIWKYGGQEVTIQINEH